MRKVLKMDNGQIALVTLMKGKIDADDKQSLMRDFVKMLKITDDDMMNIIYVIKKLYNSVGDRYLFNTDIWNIDIFNIE